MWYIILGKCKSVKQKTLAHFCTWMFVYFRYKQELLTRQWEKTNRKSWERHPHFIDSKYQNIEEVNENITSRGGWLWDRNIVETAWQSFRDANKLQIFRWIISLTVRTACLYRLRTICCLYWSPTITMIIWVQSDVVQITFQMQISVVEGDAPGNHALSIIIDRTTRLLDRAISIILLDFQIISGISIPLRFSR